MTITEFAEKHRLKITLDECRDQIIQGRHGHLYFDGEQLCAMWLNARPINVSRLKELEGEVWQGDISVLNGKRVQDAKVIGISLDKAALAIRLVGAKRRRIMSDAQKASLAKAQELSPLGRKPAGEH